MLEEISNIIGTQTYLVIATVAGTMLLAGFIRGFVGFGASLIIVMVLSIIKEPVSYTHLRAHET